MELHESLAELVAAVGPQVLDDADGLRAALDDYLDEGAASTGDINLLVDAVRLGAYTWMMSTIASGGEGAKAVEAAGVLLARDRGSRDLDTARWACAVLGFAMGKVGDADVRRYRTRSMEVPSDPAVTTGGTSQGTTEAAPVVAPDVATAPVQPPLAPVTQAAQPVVIAPGSPPPSPDRTGGRRTPGLAAVLSVLVVLALVAGGFAAWRLLGDDDPGAGQVTAIDSTEPASPTAPGTDDPSAGPSAKPSAEPEPLPFSVDAAFVNQPCTGEVIVMLATAGVADNYAAKLGNAVGGVSDAKVLRASDSCEAFQRTHPESGQPIYNAYVGPFATVSEACQAIDGLDSATAWVRELANPSQERELCFCESSADALTRVGPETDLTSLAVRRLIGQVQWGLYLFGLIPKEGVFQSYGQRTPDFVAALQEFQSQVLLTPDGVITGETWERLLDEFCETEVYDVER